MRNRSKSLWKNKSKCYSHKRPVSKVSWDESLPRQPSDVGLLREPPCPGCPPELWGFPGHFQCRERFCHLRNPWNRKMINQQENKKPGEEVSFSWCILHRVGIMGNGQKKHGANGSFWSGSKPLILDRVGFVRAVTELEQGLWAAVRSAQSSTKCEEPPCCCSTPKECCCGTAPWAPGPTEQWKSKVIDLVCCFQNITLYSRNSKTSCSYRRHLNFLL